MSFRLCYFELYIMALILGGMEGRWVSPIVWSPLHHLPVCIQPLGPIVPDESQMFSLTAAPPSAQHTLANAEINTYMFN